MFLPFQGYNARGALLFYYPGCYPGLTRRIPFQGIYSTYAQFNNTTAPFLLYSVYYQLQIYLRMLCNSH